MAGTIDRDGLLHVFNEYPWLVKLLTEEADWWPLEGGGYHFSVTVEDVEERRDGIEALAAALGCEIVDELADTDPFPPPDHPPVRYDDLPRPHGVDEGLESRRPQRKRTAPKGRSLGSGGRI